MPTASAEIAFWRALYGDHPYSRRATTRELARIERSDVDAWLARTYRPDNAVIAIVGDVNLDEAEALARHWLSPWTSAYRPPEGQVTIYPGSPATALPQPVADATAVLVTPRAGSQEVALQLGCLLPETADVRRAAAHEVLAELVRDRIDRRVREELGAGDKVQASATLLAGGTATLVVTATLSRADLPGVLADVRERWEDFSHGRLADDEITRARRRAAARVTTELTTSASIASKLLEAHRRGWGEQALDRQDLIEHLTRADLEPELAVCRQRTVLSLIGDPPVVERALADASGRR
jgi:predicted Zn-dependent peptidase